MLLMLLHCNYSCHSTIASAVTWIVHSICLKSQNQGNGLHQWLSDVCVFLLKAVFDILENSQGGNLIKLYSSIEQL